MSTKDLIDALAAGDATAIETEFNSAMAEKISARLDGMRQEVAKNMFASEAAVEDPVEAEVSSEETVENQ
jgi:hypothetical protein